MTDMRHLEFMKGVADEDVSELRRKEATYKGSWKKRDNVGTFMMLARKWDRLEQMAKERDWDVLDRPGDGSDGTMIAEIRDLRRYLLLVEAELHAIGKIAGHSNAMSIADQINRDIREGTFPKKSEATLREESLYKPGTPEDGGQHASLYPWVVGLDHYPWDNFGFWYRRVGSDRWVLEPFVHGSHVAPQELKSLYTLALEGWIIDLRQCPPGARGHFPVLQEEVNHFELSKLPDWQQRLYKWHADADKYIVRNREWCELDEEAA